MNPAETQQNDRRFLVVRVSTTTAIDRRSRRFLPFAPAMIALSIGMLGGCGSRSGPESTGSEPSLEGVTLRVGVVAEPGNREAAALLAPLNAQRGEWEAGRSARVEVLSAAIPTDAAANADVDVLVFPGRLLGSLVDVGAVSAIPVDILLPKSTEGGAVEEAAPPSEAPENTSEDPFAINDILPVYRDRTIRYGSDLMALPVGGSGLVLAYRRDAFESEANRVAASEAGVTLEPPTTYEQLDALARFFHGRDWDGGGAAKSGIALAFRGDSEDLSTSILLARAATLGLHPDYFSFLFNDDTMEPEVDEAPFVDALAGLAALAEFGPEGVRGFDAEAARAAFRSGQAALLIDRAEMASRWTDPDGSAQVGVAPLPGSLRVFDPVRKTYQDLDVPSRPSYLPSGGGWLAGLASRTEGRQRAAALDFLRYLAGPETTARLLVDRDAPVLPTRTSQLGGGLPDPRSAPGVESRGWARAVAGTLTAARVVPGLRLPAADEYLDLLQTRGLDAVVQGTVAPESAMRDVAQGWADLTKRLGTERQRWHYRRSIGRQSAIDPAQPPPRPASSEPAAE